MILTVCLSPCIDVTMELDSLAVGKTNVVKGKRFAFGGKALGVAIGVSRLGKEGWATGFMYNENGYLFEQALDKEGVPFTFVWNQGRVRENYKFIDKKSMLTEVNDVGAEVEERKKKELLELVSALSQKSDVVVVSGGIPKGVAPSYYGELLACVDKKCKRIVDATGERLLSALERGVDLVKPNLDELEDLLGRRMKDREEILSGCFELLDRGAKKVLLSLGKKGAIITDGTQHYYCRSMNVTVNSTVGAGDGMVSASAVALEEDVEIKEILRRGVAAGTATVTMAGNVSFAREKYEEIYRNLVVEKF